MLLIPGSFESADGVNVYSSCADFLIEFCFCFDQFYGKNTNPGDGLLRDFHNLRSDFPGDETVERRLTITPFSY